MDNLSRKDRERLAREREIVAAAERVFSQKGFGDASMDEIAKEAQFTKRTLYQYFVNKEDLYLAVVVKIFGELYAYLSDKDDVSLTGFARLERSFENLYDFHSGHHEAFRMIGQLGLVTRNPGSGSGKAAELLQWNEAIRKLLTDTLEAGRNDGSLRGDIDTGRAAASLMFIITGFFSQLSLSGESYTAHLSQGIRDFCFYSFGLILDSVKSAADI